MNGNDTYSSRDSGRHGSSREHYPSRGDRDERRDRERERDRDRDRDRRRRSRSPRHARREYEGDTYSMSRDYREREREERYAGRDRRDDRGGWERDRGAGRERRRDEEERPPRRDRDLFEDRGGRNRREREPHPARERKRSATPPPKKKEPTPDLTDVVSILDRKRRMTQWDIKPPGYENITAEQAKLSGMFPLPGAPRQQQMDPSRLQAFMNNSAGSASATALKPSQARQSKRLFVFNIPSNATNDSITDFFNLQLNGLNVVTAVDPCVSSHISSDRAFALLEFKSPQDATMALALDGISMEEDDAMDTSNGATNGNASGLKIRRPKDYIVPAVSSDGNPQEGVVSNIVEDTQNKLCISNIPVYLTEEQVTELLVNVGALRAFVLVKDTGTDQSRGIAFCEYDDPANTEYAIEGLNGMELGDQRLKIQRASIGIQQAAGLESGVNAIGMLAGTTSSAVDVEQSRVIQLLNMVTPEELMDHEEYQEICDDVKDECSKYGRVLEIKVPRPAGGRQNPGVGKIFVKYEDYASAQKALQALAGRKFADRTVVVTHFAEEYFDINAW